MLDPRGNHHAHAGANAYAHQPQPGPPGPHGPPATYGPPRTYGPYAAPVPPAPRVPRRAGEARRYSAVTLDLLLALTVALGVAAALGNGAPAGDSSQRGPVLAAVVGSLFGASFVNQVLLTWAGGASVGKFVTRIRVVRVPGGGRPGPFRLTWRWLSGMCWLPLQPYYWLRSWILVFTGGSARGNVGDNEDGDLYEDMCGVRQVRRKDLDRIERAPVPGEPYPPSR